MATIDSLQVPDHPELLLDMPIPYRGMHRHIWAAHDRMFDWLAGHGLLPAKSNLSVLKGTRCDLLTGCYFPETDLPTLTLLDQFMGWGMVLDDQVDDGQCGLDPARTSAVIAELTTILEDAPPARLTPVGSALADWWSRARAGRGVGWRRQFVDSTVRWLNTYRAETRQWAEAFIPSMAEYLEHRMHSIGSWTYSDLGEIANREELPGHIRCLPAYARMRVPMALHVALANDVLSHRKEREVGRQADAITVLCVHTGASHAEALRRLVDMINGYLRDFLAAEQDFYAEVGTRDPESLPVAQRVGISLRTHIRASLEWEIEAVERFGADDYYLRGSDPSVEDLLVAPGGPA